MKCIPCIVYVGSFLIVVSTFRSTVMTYGGLVVCRVDGFVDFGVLKLGVPVEWVLIV